MKNEYRFLLFDGVAAKMKTDETKLNFVIIKETFDFVKSQFKNFAEQNLQ